MNGLVVLLWAVAAALVLIVVGIFVSLLLMGRISLAPASEPVSAPTDATAAQVDTSYRVLILNATTQKGLVAPAREKLLAEGWQDDAVFGSDAATEEFARTTVFYVDEADEAAALGVADVLEGAAVEQSDFYADLNDTDLPQLTVVIGTDRTDGGSGGAQDPRDAPAS